MNNDQTSMTEFQITQLGGAGYNGQDHLTTKENDINQMLMMKNQDSPMPSFVILQSKNPSISGNNSLSFITDNTSTLRNHPRETRKIDINLQAL